MVKENFITYDEIHKFLLILDIMKKNSLVNNIDTMSSLLCSGLKYDYINYMKRVFINIYIIISKLMI